jgi:SAM-dependent methyltransferase
VENEEKIIAALDDVLPRLNLDLPPKDIDFCRRVFDPPLGRYRNRLLAIGFQGKDRVLDACAGFGQWSMMLSRLNEQVDAFDISGERMRLLQALAAELGLDNIQTEVAQLTSMPYPDNTFSAAFCYGSIFCTPWRESLQELQRVLKPGGQLYLTANGFGYQVYVWMEEPNKTDYFAPRDFVPQTLQNTLDYQNTGKPQPWAQIIVEPAEMHDALNEFGFMVVSQAAEGGIDISGGLHPPKPFFPGEYNGLICCYEVLAQKNS